MGKVIRIGEGSYKGIADKSIDAGKFSDGAWEELIGSILPEKVDETIEGKINEKSKEIDATLAGLRADLTAEATRATAAEQVLQARLSEVSQKQSQDVTMLQNLLAGCIGRIEALEAQIAALTSEAVTSSDVRTIKMVTADEYNNLVDTGSEDANTCYMIKE